MKSLIIDSHVHVFPDTLSDFLEGTPAHPAVEFVAKMRRKGRKNFAPVRRSLHGLQPLLRYVPENIRKKTDSLSYTSVFSSLLIEGTVADLLETMKEEKVDRAIIIAAPPHASNDFILEVAQEHPELIPVVNIPPGDQSKLGDFVARGARALKIHAAIDGQGPDSPHYRRLLGEAEELGLPVIVHTGCIHMKLVYRDPELGKAERFRSWFKDFPKVQFILAHMNFHEPEIALELCKDFSNLHVDTSWQPPLVIKKAIKYLGPERVLFGTDWPLVGDNISIGLRRIEACVDHGLSQENSKLVLGLNAQRLFKV